MEFYLFHFLYALLSTYNTSIFLDFGGWSGSAMMLGKLPVPWRPTVWTTVGQGPPALAVGAGWGCLDFFPLVYHFSLLSSFLWEADRYRLKYCIKGPLSPNQPTNQILDFVCDFGHFDMLMYTCEVSVL